MSQPQSEDTQVVVYWNSGGEVSVWVGKSAEWPAHQAAYSIAPSDLVSQLAFEGAPKAPASLSFPEA